MKHIELVHAEYHALQGANINDCLQELAQHIPHTGSVSLIHNSTRVTMKAESTESKGGSE